MKRVLCARLHKKLVRVLFGFRLGLGVKDSVGGLVVVVRHRFFNRHHNVPWEQPGLIRLQTLFQLQVGVSPHEELDKLLTEHPRSTRYVCMPIQNREGVPCPYQSL